MAFITTTANAISSGGTISGDITIDGDLTINGGGGFSYSEVLTGDMKITNTAASTAFEVQQDTGAGIALLIDQNTNQNSLQIDTASTAYSAIQIASPATTNGNIVGIYGVDSITTGRLMYLESDSSDTSSRKLIDLVNNNTAATGATCLHIQQDSTGSALTAIGAAGSGSASGAVMKLQTSETTVVDGDYLGRIEFSAPSEASGTDAILAGAAIWAEADDTFAADNNSTELVFGTNTSAAYTERMRIDSSGRVGIGSSNPSDYNSFADDLVVANSGNAGITIASTGSGYSSIYFADATSGTGEYAGGVEYNHATTVMKIWSNATQGGIILDANSKISLSNNDSNTNNTIFGKSAFNTTSDVGADGNVVIGELAMGTGTLAAAQNNTAIGYRALTDLTSGDNNVVVGKDSATNMTTGRNNVAIGGDSLYTSTDVDSCVAIGKNAMYGGNATAAADGTVAIGSDAGRNITSGAGNTAVGYQAGDVITTGSENTILGYACDVASNDNTNNVIIGNNLTGTDKDNAVFIGNDTNHIENDFNADATWNYSSDARQKTNIEDDTLGLDFINDLRTVTYKHKSPSEFPKEWSAYNADDKEPMGGDKTIHGLIAQEVKEALDKQGVDTFGGWSVGDDGRQRISAEKMVMPLIKAVQELSARVEELEKK